MIKKFRFLNFLKTAILLLLIYLIVILCTLFVFSDKLTYQELVAVSDFYEEIRLTDKDIKNDFYVDNIVKIIDKDIVYEELRKDALLYTLKISENAFEMYLRNYEGAEALAYLNRCDTNFDVFKDLECNNELIELYKSFFRADTKTIEDLDTFNELMLDILTPEYEYIDAVVSTRQSTIIICIITYIVLSVGLSMIDIKKWLKGDKK